MVKNLPANAGDARDAGWILKSARSSGEGNGNPLQYSCQENTMDRGAWWATVHGAARSRTWLNDWALHYKKLLEVASAKYWEEKQETLVLNWHFLLFHQISIKACGIYYSRGKCLFWLHWFHHFNAGGALILLSQLSCVLGLPVLYLNTRQIHHG